MKFEIKNRLNGSIIFSSECDSFRACVELAIKSSADLSYADLSSANLSYANLRSADLRSANLSYADLSYANLRYADLSYAKDDFFDKLSKLKDETPYLYMAIMDGKIDGSVYEGDCACFCGTLANAKKINYEELESFGVVPAPSSPIERLFLAIKKGDMPENNAVSTLVRDWIIEFCEVEKITLPKRKVVWE